MGYLGEIKGRVASTQKRKSREFDVIAWIRMDENRVNLLSGFTQNRSDRAPEQTFLELLVTSKCLFLDDDRTVRVVDEMES